jgi:hypothetical protein
LAVGSPLAPAGAATLYTHIDDLVESVRAITRSALGRRRRLPGSGRRAVAGPRPARLGGDPGPDH